MEDYNCSGLLQKSSLFNITKAPKLSAEGSNAEHTLG